MGKKSGNRGSGDDKNLRNRIEGFGSGPMPPPVPETFEDRLHSALSQDETLGDWYNSARTGLDAMVTAFDDTVNAIADTIEDTVSAVVGDDDWDPADQPQNKNQQAKKDRNKGPKPEKDDGERSDVKWDDVVTQICDEGDLENFVLLVRSQCANQAEEKEVAGRLSEQLLTAEKPSDVIRVLYVMQACEEGDVPVVMDVIREKCQTKLEKLKTQTFFRALATQVLADGPPAKKEKKAKENGEEKKEAEPAKPVDLLDMAEPAKASQAASSSGGMVDLLAMDSSPAASPAAKVDLLDMTTPASAAPPRDLLSLDATPMLQPTIASPAPTLTQAFPGPPPAQNSAFGLFPPAPPPQQSIGQWNAFQTGSASSAQAPMGIAPKSGVNNLMSLGSMSTATPGYNQGFGPTPVLQPTNAGFDNFDPNAKSLPSGPPIKVTRGMAGMSHVSMGASAQAAAHDPFASLAMPAMAGGAVGPKGMGMAGNSGNSFSTSRSGAAQPAAQKDPLQFDDVLSSELAKMNLVN